MGAEVFCPQLKVTLLILETIILTYNLTQIVHEEAKAEVMKCFCYAKPLSGPVSRGSANRATFANDESRPGSRSPQDWHIISPFYHTASPFTLPLTQPGPHQTNYLNCLGESNGRTFRPQCIVSRPYPQVLRAPQQRALRPLWGL